MEFATLNKGQLLLTVPESGQDISNGALGPFLYCLTHVVGGALFSAAESLRLIKIRVSSSAKVYFHVGNPDHIPYPEISRSFDIIDMKITKSKDWPIGFRQMLLLNSQAVESWSSDRETLEAEFLEQFSNLTEHRLKSDCFFMSDFSTADQIAMASLVAHNLGMNPHNRMPKEEAEKRIEVALQRIGAC